MNSTTTPIFYNFTLSENPTTTTTTTTSWIVTTSIDINDDEDFSFSEKQFAMALLFSVVPFLGTLVVILLVFTMLRRAFTLRKKYKRRQKEKQLKVLEDLLRSVVDSREERRLHEQAFLDHHLRRSARTSRAPNLSASVKKYLNTKRSKVDLSNDDDPPFHHLHHKKHHQQQQPEELKYMSEAIDKMARDSHSPPKNIIEKEILEVINEMTGSKIRNNASSAVFRSELRSSTRHNNNVLSDEALNEIRLRVDEDAHSSHSDHGIVMRLDRQPSSSFLDIPQLVWHRVSSSRKKSVKRSDSSAFEPIQKDPKSTATESREEDVVRTGIFTITKVNEGADNQAFSKQ